MYIDVCTLMYISVACASAVHEELAKVTVADAVAAAAAASAAAVSCDGAVFLAMISTIKTLVI